MTKFKLIQRGYFKKDVKEGYLLDEGGIVGLGYMGSAEFEFGTIPKAYRRIMHNYLNYDIFGTNIFTPENEELMLFCRKDRATELKESIQAFIEHPYHLKEFSELEKVPKAKKEDTGFSRRRTDFWWCIDIGIGDWMAFLKPKEQQIKKALKKDYEEWWLMKPEEEREEKYKKSLEW